MKKMVAVVLLSGWSAVWADYTMVFEMKDPKKPEDAVQSTFRYKDEAHRRIDMKLQGRTLSSMLVSGQKAYIVSYDDKGVPTVMDADAMMQMAQKFGGASNGQRQSGKAEKPEKMQWRNTGRHRTVAGIKGEVWELDYEEDGKPKTTTVVLTKDPEYIEAMKAYEGTMKRMMSGGAEVSASQYMMGIKPGYAPLAVEGAFTLKKMDDHRVDSEAFALPKGAAVQKSPFGALFGASGGKKGNGEHATLEDACYTKVCCGQTQGAAEVLPKMTAKSAMGYRLENTAKCEMLGLGALFGVDSVEGALYKKGSDGITVTLDMDAKDEGTVRKAKNGGMALSSYRSGKIGGATYYYAVLEAQGVQTLDIVIEEGVIVSLSHRMSGGTVDLVRFAKKALDLDAYKSAANQEAPAAEKPEPKKKEKSGKTDDEDPFSSDKINKNVDKAVDFLKSIF